MLKLPFEKVFSFDEITQQHNKNTKTNRKMTMNFKINLYFVSSNSTIFAFITTFATM